MSTPTKYLQILGGIIKTDTTLTQSKVAADAKAVGDKIEARFNELSVLVGDTAVSDQLSIAVSDKVNATDVITNAEIDEICNAVILNAEEASF